jgi:hypothetical protein
MTAEPGAFDLRKFRSVSVSLFDEQQIPAIMLQKDEIKFSMSCVRKMDCDNYVELMVHPLQKKIAIRPTKKENRYAIQWTSGGKTNKESRSISCKAFIETLFQIFDWELDYKYKLFGSVHTEGKESACIFTTTDAGVYIKKEQIISAGIDASGQFLSQSGKRVRGFAGDVGKRLGQDYYVEKTMQEMVRQTREQWQTRIEGRMCTTWEKLKVTPYEELRDYIRQELGELFEEVKPDAGTE